MSHSRKIHNLLHVALGKHRKTGLATSHDIGVVTKDVERVGGHRTGTHMEYRWEALGGDLVHIRDHKKQTLRCGICRGERTYPQ